MLYIVLAIKPALAWDTQTYAVLASSSSGATSIEIDAVDFAMKRIKSYRSFLPGWALDIALRAYDAYQTYRNGERVEEIRAEVLATLGEIIEIKANMEAGQEMSDREYRLTRELLDTRISQIETLVGALSLRVDELENRFFRRGCGKYHFWSNGRCVDVRTAR